MKLKIIITVILATILALLLSYRTTRDPDKATAYFEKGKKHFSEGNLDQAIKMYRKGLKNDSKSSEGYNLLGMAYRSKYFASKKKDTKSFRKAIDAFQESIKADSRNWYPEVNIGTTYYYSGDKKAAVPHLVRALELYPQHLEAKKIKEMIEEGKKER